MNDDRFFERLRDDARHLQITPDGVTAARIAARVRARVAAQPTMSQMLAAWLRPVLASVTALAFAAIVGLTWLDAAETSSNNVTMDAMASSTSTYEMALDGETLHVAE